MDTSEQYIKMRLAAVPDLGMGKPPDARSDYWHTDSVFTDAIGNWYYSTVDDTTQLERQDQLQEMLRLSDRQLMKQFRDFLIWITGTGPSPKYPGGFYPRSKPYGHFLPTFEQLWLAFVMKEKYNKVWDGEEWVL